MVEKHLVIQCDHLFTNWTFVFLDLEWTGLILFLILLYITIDQYKALPYCIYLFILFFFSTSYPPL